MEHPDGHSDAGNPGIPEYHGRGHIHSINIKGEHFIYIWESIQFQFIGVSVEEFHISRTQKL